MRKEKDDFFVPLLAVFCILCPFFCIVGFIMISSDAVGLIPMRKYDMKMIFYIAAILGFAILWWMFLRKKRYNAIVQARDVYDKPEYRRFAVLYPVVSALVFFMGLYIGYMHNTSMACL